MAEPSSVSRRRQFCGRCGHWMFDFLASSDGHFGLASDIERQGSMEHGEVRCPACSACYHLRDRLSPRGQAVERL